MSTGSGLLRPRDTDVVRAELRRLATDGGIPVLFGGEVRGGALVLSEFVGTRTGLLRGVVVRPSTGLGGASMVAGRPLSVADYRNASNITHDYDVPVLSEGIESILAVPVVVDATPRAMLYGAYRSRAPMGGRAVDLMLDAGRRVADELRIRDEVDRRLRLRQAEAAGTASPEAVREVHAELRRLAAGVDPDTGAQLRRLAERLAGAEQPTAVTLTPRERDVLAQIALGCTNAEAAKRLSLQTETVKSYLRSAATKLGAGTRFEAVSRARLLGLLP
ncbi:helix-turn-helix transcriptional regulator [[Mycobacterium] wendilense]|uniref:LuxR C-terminal-related transcriptional regulator n=1 Tax=[Mycobacterium] wendilense TaxID=3064284 RepID=A0ABM9MKA4_9MYCO|nr:LuxR C-terminal-related transcriptional regulator [Mycolicibacterium sp. MU0050]CAJ1587283.1 LuxR C-terminal-related transcriptional regulator [Mycolicibacterium sp. MU0050]